MTAQVGVAAAQPNALGTRILELTDSLAQWSESPRALTCTYLTNAHRAVAGEIARLMSNIGLETRIDAVGNVVGRYRSHSLAAKSVIVGSHYDTVANAGKYDGRLGIVTAIAVAEQLAAAGMALPFHLDIIAFSEEEGVRFSSAYIGSSVVAGRFDRGELLRRDAKGVTMEEAMRTAGLDPANIASAARRKDDIAAYLEVHIEQGPVLFESDLPVGVVTAIAGNSRFGVSIEGVAGHAGTVPMAYRHDAAAAAAEVVLCVEQRCSRTGLVGTVGRLAVPDGAPNVVPGRCDLTIDVRSGVDADRRAATKDILADMDDIGKKRGVTIKTTSLLDAAAVQCSPRLQGLFAASVERAGLPVFRLPSGAGHDAVMFDGFTEIGMLFVRCGNGGVSHSPLETVTASDCDYAARILMDVLETLPPR